MKVKFGAIVVDGRGKIGGHVMSKNRAGAYMRTKVTPVNPRTVYQAGVRNLFATLSTAWKGLTAAQILQWNNAVASYKSTDLFGDIRNPTGLSLFQKLNNNLVRSGIVQISVPPLPVALPVITTGVLAAVHAGAVTVTFTADPLIIASVIEIDATPAISPGRSFVKSEFRRIGLMPAIVAHVATITALYTAKFGAPGAAGQRIFIRMKQISNVTGQAGIPVIYSAILT
jgi:hypothetical protein